MQRHELKACCITPEGPAAVKASKAQCSWKNKNYLPRNQRGEQAKVIAAAVEMALSKKAKDKQLVSKESTQTEAFFISILKKLASKTYTTPQTVTSNSVESLRILMSIIKKLKNA